MEKEIAQTGKTRHVLIWLIEDRSCGQKLLDASGCDDVSTRPTHNMKHCCRNGQSKRCH